MAFELKSGNRPAFKMMGSSPMKAEKVAGEDYSYYGAGKGRTESEKEIDRKASE